MFPAASTVGDDDAPEGTSTSPGAGWPVGVVTVPFPKPLTGCPVRRFSAYRTPAPLSTAYTVRPSGDNAGLATNGALLSSLGTKLHTFAPVVASYAATSG